MPSKCYGAWVARIDWSSVRRVLAWVEKLFTDLEEALKWMDAEYVRMGGMKVGGVLAYDSGQFVSLASLSTVSATRTAEVSITESVEYRSMMAVLKERGDSMKRPVTREEWEQAYKAPKATHTLAELKEYIERQAKEESERRNAEMDRAAPFVAPPTWTIMVHDKHPSEQVKGVVPTNLPDLVGMDFLRAVEVGRGRGVRVAVLDTGCTPTHPALVGKIGIAIDCTGTGPADTDESGHGTFVCSQIVSPLPTGHPFGTATDCEIIMLKVLHGAQGWGLETWIERGIRAAVAAGCEVISMSLGGADPMPLVEAALEDAMSAGAIILAAAGNGGPGLNGSAYPARYDWCISVGAVNPDHSFAHFSQRGDDLDFAAHGVAQVGALAKGGYGRWSGTSMATPHAAAAAAIVIGAGLQLNGKVPAEVAVKRALLGGGKHGVADGMETEFTPLVLQAGEAVGLLRSPGPVDPPTDPEVVKEVFYSRDYEGLWQAAQEMAAFLRGGGTHVIRFTGGTPKP